MASYADRVPELAGHTTSQAFERNAASDHAASDGHALWKGVVAGAIAGAAGAFVMEQFQTKALPKLKEMANLDEKQESEESSSSSEESSEPATTKAARQVSEKVFDHELQEGEKKWAGEAAHYAMGVTSGVIYGAAAELTPKATLGHGAGFGASVWAVADEMVVPALGLSKPPTEYPMKTHAYALASHLVYGLTVETVRRTVRRAL